MLVGLTAIKSEVVTNANTAQTFASGTLPVYATPAMIALMESAAVAAIAKEITSEESSVGVKLDVQHLAATPLNKRVTAKATLTKIDGRKLSFDVELKDDNGQLLGQGTHDRVIINIEKFMNKLK